MRTEIIEKTKQESFPICFSESKLGDGYTGFVSFINEAHIEFSTMERVGDNRIYKVFETKGSDNYLTLELNDSTCTLMGIQYAGVDFKCL